MKHMGTQMLYTERLLLRKYEANDSASVFRNWVTDEKAAEFWSWNVHQNENVTRMLIDEWMGEYENDNYYNWAIVLKESMEPVGYIYLNGIDETHKSAEVHFLLGSRWWNRGLMTEALGRVLEFALYEIGFERICSYHHLDNVASGRVMEKCGMGFMEERYRLSECERLSGIYRFYLKTKESRSAGA